MIRVLRILEYHYETPERMIDDMAAWKIQGVSKFGGQLGHMTIRSAVMVPEVLDPQIDQDLLTTINLYGDEVLHDALDRIGWVPRSNTSYGLVVTDPEQDQ